jgi:hypothetical protein
MRWKTGLSLELITRRWYETSEQGTTANIQFPIVI